LEEKNNLVLTPYEKNPKLWSELWHVLDMSDIVIQIVDARNPLLYYSADLDKHVKEINPEKVTVVLCNKADLLTESQRKTWAGYFNQHQIRAVFYSAHDELIKTADNPDDTMEGYEIGRVLNRIELIKFVKSLWSKELLGGEKLTVGLTGYPNVGKSTIVNSLLGSKRVSTSITPGKTKHYQTFNLDLDPEICICDCPGLVMPSYISSKADLVLGGTLSIDRLQSHGPVVDLLVSRIPIHVLESIYGVFLHREVDDYSQVQYLADYHALLQAYALSRGFVTSHGLPDEARSARPILKDYINGKLLYCHAPPDVAQSDFHEFPTPDPNVKQIHNSERDGLDPFFEQLSLEAHVRSNREMKSAKSDEKTEVTGKPWKKHNNKNKRTKLAKLYKHLDQ